MTTANDDIRTEKSGYRLRELFGEDAFYDRPDDVLQASRQQPRTAG
jgi:hypothetical protein